MFDTCQTAFCNSVIGSILNETFSDTKLAQWNGLIIFFLVVWGRKAFHLCPIITIKTHKLTPVPLHQALAVRQQRVSGPLHLCMLSSFILNCYLPLFKSFHQTWEKANEAESRSGNFISDPQSIIVCRLLHKPWIFSPQINWWYSDSSWQRSWDKSLHSGVGTQKTTF